MDKVTMFALLCVLIGVLYLGIKIREMDRSMKAQQVVINEYKHIMGQDNKEIKDIEFSR